MRKLAISAVALLMLAIIPRDVLSQQTDSNTKFQSFDINVSGKTCTGNARVLLPSSASPLPVVIFSHSRVNFGDTTTDLMPLAERLARDGYAVLVVERTMQWPLKDFGTNRNGHELLENAEKWALEHVRFDPLRFAYVGPNFDTGNDPDRMQSLPQDRLRVKRAIRVHLGEPENAAVTDMLRTTSGQEQLVRFIERHFEPAV